MQDPEEIYKEELEKVDEEFLKGLNEGKSLDSLEKGYTKKTKKLRKKFESSYSRFIKKNPEKSDEKKNNQNEEKEYDWMGETFKVKPLNLENSWKDRLNFSFKTKKFKTKRKFLDFVQRVTPDFILRIYYKSINSWRVFSFERNLFFEKIILKFKKNIKKTVSFFKKILNSIKVFFKNISEFLNKKFERKNKEKSSKKPDKKKENENGEK